MPILLSIILYVCGFALIFGFWLGVFNLFGKSPSAQRNRIKSLKLMSGSLFICVSIWVIILGAVK